MKKKILKLALLIVAVVTFTVFLSACDTEIDVATELSVSSDFAGERIMHTESIDQKDLGGAASANKIMDDIKDSAPDALDVEYTESNGKYNLTFSIDFSSLEDYEKKVESVIGSDVTIVYSNANTAFSSSVKLQESFTTKDLLNWVQDVVAEYGSEKLQINYTTTDLVFEGRQFASETSGRINVFSTGENTMLTSINVDTYILGLDNYSRAVTFRMSEEVFNTITQDALDAIVPKGATGGNFYIDEDAKAASKYVYQLTYSGTAEDMEIITKELFPGSTFACTGYTENVGAFSVSSVIKETIDFSRFPCNDDGTANATVVYSNGFTDETSSSGNSDVVFDVSSLNVSGENVTAAKENSESSITLSCKKSASATVSMGVTFNYGIQSVAVNTTLKGNTNLSVAILLDYDINASGMALELAESFFSEKFKEIKGVSLSSDKITRETENSTQEYYRLKILFEGTTESVAAAMNQVFGGENYFNNIYKDKFEFSTKHNISHRIDITKLLELADYSGVVSYSFHSDSASIKGVDCQLYTSDGTADGTPENNLLDGKTKLGAFTVPVSSGNFRITFQTSYVNTGYIIFIILIILVAVIGSTILLSVVARKSKARKQVEAEIFRKAKVEKALSLAVIQNNDGSIVPLSSQALANRPGAVVESKRDDGLDEDDDEPETIWLFSTTLKLLALIAGVLFFFPFVSVSCSNMTGDQSISAFSLMIGYSKGDYSMDPMPEISLLLIIPLVIFMLLFLWNKLPKFPSAIAIIAVSAFSLLLLLNMESIIEERIDSMMELTNSRDTVTSFKMQWAYSYSVIVYILLLIGSIVLLLAEVSEKVKKKFK